MNSALAMETRCCYPLESCAGVWSRQSPSPTSSKRHFALVRKSGRGVDEYRPGSITFSRAEVFGRR